MNFLNETLVWDDFYWEGIVDGPVLPDIKSNGVVLRVESEDEQQIPPHEKQVEAWKSLIEGKANYSSLILLGFYDYYLLMRPKYLLAGNDWAKNVPAISSVNDISRMLSLHAISIAWPYDGSVRLGFEFDCKWDREHGAGIVFQEGKQVEIGGSDCLY